MIYHYTTIEALAQILKNQTIRFSRLDQVDDIEEGLLESQSIKLSKHFFVSCWTDVREESIPLWRMYAGDNGGVRIGMEKDMFRDYYIHDMFLGGERAIGSGVSKLPREEMLNPDYWILPPSNSDNHFFYRKVKYVDDVNSVMADAVRKTVTVKETLPNGIVLNNVNLSLDMEVIGAIKNKRWRFEEESRFSLLIVKGNPCLETPEAFTNRLIANLENEECVDFNYYDLHLSPASLNKMEITMSPFSIPGQRIIVESLCSQYAPRAIVKDSSLKDLVRLK